MDDHRRENGLGEAAAYAPRPESTVEDGGAELVDMAADLGRVSRWIASLLGVLLTVSVVLAYGAYAGA